MMPREMVMLLWCDDVETIMWTTAMLMLLMFVIVAVILQRLTLTLSCQADIDHDPHVESMTHNKKINIIITTSTPKPLLVEPPDTVKRYPQLGRLVDVNLARLLGVRLAKLFTNVGTTQTALKDAPLTREVGGAVEAEGGGQLELVAVQQAAVRVAVVRDRVALPLDAQAAGPVGVERAERRAVVGHGLEVLVVAHDGAALARRRRWVRRRQREQRGEPTVRRGRCQGGRDGEGEAAGAGTDGTGFGHTTGRTL